MANVYLLRYFCIDEYKMIELANNTSVWQTREALADFLCRLKKEIAHEKGKVNPYDISRVHDEIFDDKEHLMQKLNTLQNNGDWEVVIRDGKEKFWVERIALMN
jgi:predicted DNA-binding protein YlxM (UPF0122 family)